MTFFFFKIIRDLYFNSSENIVISDNNKILRHFHHSTFYF